MHTKVINAGLRYHEFFGAIFKYREYLIQSVARDLRKKYKRSVLGYFWSMLNPLLTICILTLVFSNIMSRVESYSVFLFSALLSWQYFVSTAQDGLGAVRGNLNIIEQVPIPKFIFTLSTAASNLVNMMLSIVPLLLVMWVVGRAVPASILFLPLMILPLFFTSVGVALIFSVADVFFDDTKHLTGVALQALYYLCPILYGREHLPEHLIRWLELNPMFNIAETFRMIIYYGEIPSLQHYSSMLLSSALVLAFGLWVFKKADDKFIYFA